MQAAFRADRHGAVQFVHLMNRIGLALMAAAVAAALVPMDAVQVERWYSTAFYAVLQGVLTPASNAMPFALLDAAGLVLLAAWVAGIVRRGRRAGWRRAAARGASTLPAGAAAGYLCFLVLWGFNYRRVPLERRLEYDASLVSVASARELAATAAAEVNAGHAAAHATAWRREALERPFAEAQRLLGSRRAAVPGVPKHSVLQVYFRHAAIDGMTDPFFLEVIVNPDVPDVERPFVVAHEWAHLAGYAAESEANFVAWITCLRGDPLARYSAWVEAYVHALRILPADEARRVRALEPGPRGDLAARARRYARSSPAVRGAARDVYDGYLRANRVREGIASYDAVLRLMLGTRFDPGWTPRLRARHAGP